MHCALYIAHKLWMTLNASLKKQAENIYYTKDFVFDIKFKPLVKVFYHDNIAIIKTFFLWSLKS